MIIPPPVLPNPPLRHEPRRVRPHTPGARFASHMLTTSSVPAGMACGPRVVSRRASRRVSGMVGKRRRDSEMTALR